VSEQHLELGAGELRVILKSRALEILHGVALANKRIVLGEFFRLWIAKPGQPAVLSPIGEEPVGEAVPGL